MLLIYALYGSDWREFSGKCRNVKYKIRFECCKIFQMIDSALLAVVAGADSNNQPVICERVTYYDGKKAKVGIFYAAETFVALYKDTKKPPVQVIESYKWFQLQALTFSQQNTLQLKFDEGKMIEISHEQLGVFAPTIQIHLYSFMRKEELPRFNLPKMILPTKDCGSLVMRLTNIMAKKDEQINNDAVVKYKLYFRKKPTEIKLSFFEEIRENIPDLLECLFMENEVTKLIIDIPVDQRLLTALKDFLRGNTTIRTLVFTSKFECDIDGLENSFSGLISHLCINKCPLDERKAEVIRKIFENYGVSHMEFIGCMEKAVASEFFRNLSHTGNLRSLQSLSVRETFGVSVNCVLESVTGAVHLTYSDCRIDIANVLENMTGLPLLEELDLSRNISKSLISKGCNIPKTLRKIILDEMQFTDKSLTEFFCFLSGVVKPITLSMKSINMSSDSWTKFFDSCTRLAPVNVDVLHWDSNRVNKFFVLFLERFRGMTEISFRNCIGKDPSIIPDLSGYIERSRTVKFIDISTYNYQGNVEDLIQVLHAVGKNRSLTKIGICGIPMPQFIQDVLVEALMDNRRIQDLEFDFIRATADSLNRFLGVLTMRGPPLRIPVHYFETATRHLTKDEMIQVNRMFKILITGDTSVVPPDDTVSFARAPISVAGAAVGANMVAASHTPVNPFMQNDASGPNPFLDDIVQRRQQSSVPDFVIGGMQSAITAGGILDQSPTPDMGPVLQPPALFDVNPFLDSKGGSAMVLLPPMPQPVDISDCIVVNPKLNNSKEEPEDEVDEWWVAPNDWSLNCDPLVLESPMQMIEAAKQKYSIPVIIHDIRSH